MHLAALERPAIVGNQSLGRVEFSVRRPAHRQVEPVARIVEDIKRAGLVRRTPAADDRRRWVLELTPEGRRRFKAIEPAATQRYRDFLKPLSAGEATQLRRLLEKLIG